MKKILGTIFLLTITAACQNTTGSSETTDSNIDSTLVEQNDTLSHEVEVTQDVNDVDGQALVAAFRNQEEAFDFYASFTEPFITVYLKDDLAIVEGVDLPLTVYNNDSTFDPEADQQEITFGDDNKQWSLNIVAKTGSDGMSDIQYPFSVTLNNEFHGGGAETLQQVKR